MPLVLKHIQTDDSSVLAGPMDVQRFERQERAYGTFQLESLILAQNERWRQA